ncbi:MAG: LacI family DNA-binding transcriptional regulator [Clostridia bacterium]|nr:LacI family DNA-binding transcriptional regulator [Clostridia bacterium]
MASIKDVARQAGVGLGTVSRVLNGEKGVSEETRENVLNAIRALNYQRNSLAVSFRKKENKIVALLVPVIDHAFFAKLAYYVEDELDKNGYSLLVSSSQNRQSKEYAMIEKLKRKDVDGIIFVTHYDYKAEALKNYPVVSIDRHFEDVPFVTSNNFESSFQACEWLVESGCKKIAYLGGKPLVESEVTERERAYRQVMEKYGLPAIVRSEVIEHGGEQPFVRSLFEDHPDLDGIFVSGDTMTNLIFRHCQGNGISIPDQLKVASYDGVQVKTGELKDKIAYVEQPIEALGRKAVELILKKIKGEETPQKTVLEAKFVCYDQKQIENKQEEK